MCRSKYFSGNPSAGFGIGESVMVILQVIAANFGNCVQLMVLQVRKNTTCHAKSIVKLILGIVHPIALKHSPQTTLIERAVVSH